MNRSRHGITVLIARALAWASIVCISPLIFLSAVVVLKHSIKGGFLPILPDVSASCAFVPLIWLVAAANLGAAIGFRTSRRTKPMLVTSILNVLLAVLIKESLGPFDALWLPFVLLNVVILGIMLAPPVTAWSRAQTTALESNSEHLCDEDRPRNP